MAAIRFQIRVRAACRAELGMEPRTRKTRGMKVAAMLDPSPQPITAIRQVWQSAFGSRKVIYLSGPITTGHRFLVWWEEVGHKLEPSSVEYRNALRAHVIEP